MCARMPTWTTRSLSLLMVSICVCASLKTSNILLRRYVQLGPELLFHRGVCPLRRRGYLFVIKPEW